MSRARTDADWPSWTDESANLYPTTTSQQIAGLDQGAEYSVRVRARYHTGTHADSPWSGPWDGATLTVAAEPAAGARSDDEPPMPYRLGHDLLGSNAAHTLPACHARTAILADPRGT